LPSPAAAAAACEPLARLHARRRARQSRSRAVDCSRLWILVVPIVWPTPPMCCRFMATTCQFCGTEHGRILDAEYPALSCRNGTPRGRRSRACARQLCLAHPWAPTQMHWGPRVCSCIDASP